jgi:ribonuclease-3
MNYTTLENNIEYIFNDKKLLQKAFTHTSYANTKNIESNEKLEFFGDSILEYISSEYIYKNYIKLKEGEMTKVRATVVCEDSLYNIALKYKFYDYLLLGKSEQHNEKTRLKAILADSVEALIAAMCIDGGIEVAKKFIIKNLKESIEIASKNVGIKDYKTVLQEKLQIHGNVKIKYEIIKEEGPDHDKKFVSQVSCDETILAIGEGKSKKLAEMQAAHHALEKIEKKG